MARILVVDDSLSVRKALEKILNSHAEVSVAVSGEDALAQLHGGLPVPDLIISDVLMPGMSGPELARALSALSTTAHVPVVLISGVIDDEVHRQAHEVGARAVVRKPFSADELLPVIRRALSLEEAPSPEEAPHLETLHPDGAPAQQPAWAEPGGYPEAPYEPELDTGWVHPEPRSGAPEVSGPALATAATGVSGATWATSAEALLSPLQAVAPASPALPLPGKTPVDLHSVADAASGDLDGRSWVVQPESSWAVQGRAEPAEVAPEQPASAAAGPGDLSDLATLVQALIQKPGVLGALVSSTTAELHTQAGELGLSAADLSMYARFFLGTSDTLGLRLGRGEAAGVQLDYRGGALLLLPLDPQHLLVCLLADANSGSMVRFTLRRHLAAVTASV